MGRGGRAGSDDAMIRKVAMISPTYPSMYCGISTYTQYLSNSLSNLVELEIVGSLRIRNLNSAIQEINRAAQTADIIHIQHAIGNFGYMGLWTIPLYLSLRKSDKPIVTTIHELPSVSPKSIKDRVAFSYLRWIILAIIRLSTVTIVHTEDSLERLKPGKYGSKIHIIPHGSDGSLTISEQNSCLHTPTTLGCFGFIRQSKGIHLILPALARLTDTQLLIAGSPKDSADEEYTKQLIREVQSLGLSDRVRFLGFIPDDSMDDFFRSIDIVVFPYTSSTASGAAHLALAHNCVVLTSDLPVFEEMKRGYNCIETFSLSESGSLEDRLRGLLVSEDKRRELLNGVQRMVNETGWPVVAEKTWMLYQSCSAEASPSSLARKVDRCR